jgi:hypothetical protein
MHDFRPAKPDKNQRYAPSASPGSREDGFSFNGLDPDDGDPTVASLMDAVSGVLGPMGVRSVSFAEPDEITDARGRTRGREHAYLHISDGTPNGCLCGFTVQNIAPSGTPECPVCVLLDG